METAAKFIIYQDFNGGYRWRLRSPVGETIATSVRGHDEKHGCENELGRWRIEYPEVPVRDATVRGPKCSLLPTDSQAPS